MEAHQELEAALQEPLTRFSLGEHPLLAAFASGEVPLSNLRGFAAQYTGCIVAAPLGWEEVGDLEHAKLEREHALLWLRFVRAAGSNVADSRLQEVVELDATARGLFGSRSTALGALYAFEMQQISLSCSIMKGLEKPEELEGGVGDYFLAHKQCEHECDELLTTIMDLQPWERSMNVAACQRLCELMYIAMDAIAHASVPRQKDATESATAES